jgi:hypothetical protein
MSVTTDGSEESAISLEQLDGAVLTYETADGETVVVEFDD